LYFLEALMLYALLQESPLIGSAEANDIDDNLLLVAHCGRDPELRLKKEGNLLGLRDWADQIMEEMQSICELLDRSSEAPVYSHALKQQREKVYRPELTPSAKMMAVIEKNKESFFHYAMRISLSHKEWFSDHSIAKDEQQMLDQLAAVSKQKQSEIEAGDNQSFESFLEEYFAQ